MRTLNPYEKVNYGTYSDYQRDSVAPKVAEQQQFEDVLTPAVQISVKFMFQSYYDQVLLQNAILSQLPNQPIVPARALNAVATGLNYVDTSPLESQVRGYALGLHPSSQTPIAAEFRGGQKVSTSTTYVLKPGQIIRPSGKVGAKSTAFNGFRYGIPFGWLGGGLATVVVFQTPDSDVLWQGNPEIIFHRLTVPIKQPTDLTVGGGYNNAPLNWPLRFPWSQALQGTNLTSQKGAAQLAVNPTKVILTLRGVSGTFASLAQPATMRIAFQASNDFALDSTGATQLTLQPVFEDVTWPSFSSVGTSGNLSKQNPTIVLTGLTSRLAADDGGVVFIDTSPGGLLNGLFVDVCRYGTL